MDYDMFAWNELNTSDPAGATRFFETVLGWTVAEMPTSNGAYWIASVGERYVAGIFDLKTIDKPGVPDHWIGYVAVADVDDRFAKATSAGAAVVRAPFDIEGVGRIAIVHMPGGGAILGMMTPAPRTG